MLRNGARQDPSDQRPRSVPPFSPELHGERDGLFSVAISPAEARPSSVVGIYPDGEIALRRAVLHDAIRCFQQQFFVTSRQQRRFATEAEHWLFSNDTQWPFSFVNVCAVLGLDPAYLRRRLRHWPQSPAGSRTRSQRSPVR